MHENIAGHRTEAPPYFFVTLLRATAILYAENITSLFLLCYKSAIHLYLYSLNSIILEIVVSPNLRKMQFCTQTAKESHPYPAEKSRTQNRQTAQYQPVGRRAALHTSEERAHSRSAGKHKIHRGDHHYETKPTRTITHPLADPHSGISRHAHMGSRGSSPGWKRRRVIH